MIGSEVLLLPAFLVSRQLQIDGVIALAAVGLVAFIIHLIPFAAMIQPFTGSCPNCGSKDIRRSKVDGVADQIRQALSFQPGRCRSCRKRFFTRETSDSQPIELTR